MPGLRVECRPLGVIGSGLDTGQDIGEGLPPGLDRFPPGHGLKPGTARARIEPGPGHRYGYPVAEFIKPGKPPARIKIDFRHRKTLR
jgi:hypothetical protein